MEAIRTALDRIKSKPFVTVKEGLAKPSQEIVYIPVAISGWECRQTSAGKPFINLSVSDATGKLEIKIWGTETFGSSEGSVIMLKGRVGEYQGQPQIDYIDHVLISNSYSDLLKEGSDLANSIANSVGRVYQTRLCDQLATLLGAYADFKVLYPECASVMGHVFKIRWTSDDIYEVFGKSIYDEGDPDKPNLPLSQAMDVLGSEFKSRLSDGGETLEKYMNAPAAIGHHGAKIHGLIVHSTDMFNMIDKTFESYESNVVHGTPQDTLDVHMLKLAALIHDFYKIEEYDWSTGVIKYVKGDNEFSHDIKLCHEIAALVKSGEISKDFGHKLSQIILMHHGDWSNYKPMPREKVYDEAHIFHLFDMLESRIVGNMEK